MPFPQRVRLLLGSLRPSKFGEEISSFADPGCLSQIPDSGFKFFPSWIPDPGSEFFTSRVLDPGSASKNLSILTKKMVSQLSEIWSEFSIRDPDPGSGTWLFTHPQSWSCIPDPESRGQKGTGALIPDPGSGFATLEILALLRLKGVPLVTDFQRALLS